MHSREDYDRPYIRFMREAYLIDESIRTFCHQNDVPYVFEKWYKDTRYKHSNKVSIMILEYLRRDLLCLFDFHARLQRAALRCAKGVYGNRGIHHEWNDMLLFILHKWEIHAHMCLSEAVDYMMAVCGFGDFRGRSIASDESDFWFLLSEQYRKLDIDKFKFNSERIYYITIAIFETLNYWCWYNSNVKIPLDYEELKGVLKYGKISIRFESYDKIN